MLKDYIFTSESVTEGHPDKIADSISDSVLDAMLAQDPNTRSACEAMVTTGLTVVAGEVTTKANIDFQEVIRNRIKEIGYDSSEKGFDYKTCSVMVSLDKQSQDISQGVNEGEGRFLEQGAGDQGMMFGYAINETDNFMPLSIDLSHKLALRLSKVRKSGKCNFLYPDGKTQVSIEYEGGKFKRIASIIISSQHSRDVRSSQIEEFIIEEVVKPTIPTNYIDKKTNIFINSTGLFVVGGPMGDCGLTGRKIIVDTYGGHGAHGGGAFSGKDPSKVDRSAAYASRNIAKNIVAAGLADKVLVQVAYAIGVAKPVSLLVETFGTEKVPLDRINKKVIELFDMRPKSIIENLNLLKPIYTPTSSYGHFGRDSEGNLFPWEKLDKVEQLKCIL